MNLRQTPRHSPEKSVRPRNANPMSQFPVDSSKNTATEDITKTNQLKNSSGPRVRFETERALSTASQRTLTSGTSRFFRNLTVYVRELSENVDLHGVVYIFETGRAVLERVFWLAIHTTSLISLTLLTIMIHRMYKDTPIIVSFASEDTPTFNVPFPAVTICSQVKTISDIPRFAQIRNEYVKEKKFSDEKYRALYELYYVVCENTLSLQKDSISHEGTFGPLNASFYEFFKKISPGIDDLMFQCSFLGEVQNCSNLFKPIYTDVGLCFSFNLVEWKEIFTDKTLVQYPGFFEADISGSDWSGRREYKDMHKVDTYPRRGYQPGAINSLIVKLMQQKQDVDPVCTSGIEGFKIAIHDPLEIPIFTHEHIQVSLNTTVLASIEPVVTKADIELRRLSPQVKKCYHPKERSLKFLRRYSRNTCLTECYANFTNEICNCVPFFLPHDNNTPICGVSKLKCMADAKMTFLTSTFKEDVEDIRSSKQCDCKSNCNELRYNAEISHSEWDWSDAKIDAAFRKHHYEVSRFTIYFKSNHFLLRNRIEVYSFTELMANIGGLLNFFAGSSIVTFLEVTYTFTLKIFCNKFIYGPWAGPVSAEYRFED